MYYKGKGVPEDYVEAYKGIYLRPHKETRMPIRKWKYCVRECLPSRLRKPSGGRPHSGVKGVASLLLTFEMIAGSGSINSYCVHSTTFPSIIASQFCPSILPDLRPDLRQDKRAYCVEKRGREAEKQEREIVAGLPLVLFKSDSLPVNFSVLRPEVGRQIFDCFSDDLQVTHYGILDHVIPKERLSAIARVRFDSQKSVENMTQVNFGVFHISTAVARI